MRSNVAEEPSMRSAVGLDTELGCFEQCDMEYTDKSEGSELCETSRAKRFVSHPKSPELVNVFSPPNDPGTSGRLLLRKILGSSNFMIVIHPVPAEDIVSAAALANHLDCLKRSKLAQGGIRVGTIPVDAFSLALSNPLVLVDGL